MKYIFSAILTILSTAAFGQQATSDATTEIGFDGYFGASNLGGAAGIGAKFGFKLSNNIIAGPSVRLQRSWSNYYGDKFGYTVYGGGAWLHSRFMNYLFVGAEFELLNSPQNYIYVGPQRNWVPTLFLGGGFSREFNSSIRLNAGIFYDVINNGYSPFRFSYLMHKANGVLIPIIYRIGVFIPLN